jgi:hypothetical protein
MAKQIVGTIPWIQNGKQTTKIVDAKKAFSDPEQAAAQVAFFDAIGDPQQKRLARLAFQQYIGKRLRGPNKGVKNKKPSKKQATKAVKGKKTAR